MPLFLAKDKPETVNPQFIQTLTIGRKVTVQRIFFHLLYWTWISYETYNDFDRFLRIDPDVAPNPELHRFMFLTHVFISILTYYVVGYQVLPSLIKVLLYYEAVRTILWKQIVFLVVSFVLIFLVYNVYDYYVFGYALTHYAPVPGFIERNAKYVVDLGPVGFFTSQRTQSFLWAFNLSYLMLPSQLRLLRWMTYWGVDNLVKQEQNQNLIQNQLRYLQDQINPHFLFNVLNNLYAHIHRTHQEAALLLRRLIEFLKYTLYRTHENYVELKEELRFVENYVEIEQSRLADPGLIKFVKRGTIQDQLVPPLLLLTFIENAFKHGVHKSWGDGWIKIDIDIEEKPAVLRMKIRNSICADSVDTASSAQTKSGIGIYNAKQRLSLLFRPDQYKLVIDEDNTVFQVFLEIPLHSSSVVNYEYEPD